MGGRCTSRGNCIEERQNSGVGRELRPDTSRHIGGHAGDLRGYVAGRCLVFDLVLRLLLAPAMPELVPPRSVDRH